MVLVNYRPLAEEIANSAVIVPASGVRQVRCPGTVASLSVICFLVFFLLYATVMLMDDVGLAGEGSNDVPDLA